MLFCFFKPLCPAPIRESAVYVQGPLKRQLTAPWLRSSLLVSPATGGRENRTCQMENVSYSRSGERKKGWGEGGRGGGGGPAGGDLGGSSRCPPPGWCPGLGKLAGGEASFLNEGAATQSRGLGAVGRRGEETAKQD